jgi:hypothetical protein
MRVELARLRDDARVARVDAVDVGVDLADVGVERGGQGHGARDRAAAAERRDVALLVDALEAGDDRDRVLSSDRRQAVDVDRGVMRAVRRRCRSRSGPDAEETIAPARPCAASASAVSAAVTCSPVATSASLSRSSGIGGRPWRGRRSRFGLAGHRARPRRRPRWPAAADRAMRPATLPDAVDVGDRRAAVLLATTSMGAYAISAGPRVHPCRR